MLTPSLYLNPPITILMKSQALSGLILSVWNTRENGGPCASCYLSCSPTALGVISIFLDVQTAISFCRYVS